MTGMMRELNQMLGINTKLSTAYHLQIDGQTERINQELSRVLETIEKKLEMLEGNTTKRKKNIGNDSAGERARNRGAKDKRVE